MQENATISANLERLASQTGDGRMGGNTERLRREGFENKGFLPSEDSGEGSLSTAFVSNIGGDGALREEGNIVISNVYARRIDPVRGDNFVIDDEEMLLPESGTRTTGASMHMYDNSPTRITHPSSSSLNSDVFQYPSGGVTRF